MRTVSLKYFLYAPFLWLLAGCLTQDRASSTEQGLPEPPHWAFLNRFSVSALSGDDRGNTPSLSSAPNLPSYVCVAPCADQVRLVSVIQASLQEINDAINRGGELVGSHIADITPDAQGYLPRVMVPSFTSDPIILSVGGEPGQGNLLLSEELFQNGRVIIFIPGDANLDGRVDQLDLDIVMLNFEGSTPAVVPWQRGDFNGDGYVDAFDFSVVSGHLDSGLPFRLK